MESELRKSYTLVTVQAEPQKTPAGHSTLEQLIFLHY